jgi:DNA end-binding protein Ku
MPARRSDARGRKPASAGRSAAGRSTWKGSIRLSLITIPVLMFPATTSSDVSFRQLHRKCHTPIQLKKWCPHCEEDVAADDVVKGYESSKGHFVVVEQEEIEKLRPEASHVIDISSVIDAKAIDPILIERSYFLAPDSKVAGSSFAVLREGLGDRAGVGHVAMHGREYLVAVTPHDTALVMYTLRTAGEVRSASGIEQLEYADTKVKPEEAKLARQVLDHFDSAPDLSAFTDNYQESLREMLEAKGPAEAMETAGGAGRQPSNVVDLMSALKQSLDQVSAKGKKARMTRPARVIKHSTRRKAS